MQTVTEMLQAGPGVAVVSAEALAACISECFACSQASTACADACLGEAHVDGLRRCIRLNLDCADICDSAGRVLSRQQEPDVEVLRRQLELLSFACRTTGDECARHAASHTHCRVSMEACHRCGQAAERLLDELRQRLGSIETPYEH